MSKISFPQGLGLVAGVRKWYITQHIVTGLGHLDKLTSLLSSIKAR